MNDRDSAKLVSDLLGQETVVFETMSRAIDAEETGISFGAQHVGRPLLTPRTKSVRCLAIWNCCFSLASALS